MIHELKMHQQGSGLQERTPTNISPDRGINQPDQCNEERRPAVPFLYNLHILPAALPGMLFILTMAGELLLGILTVGALIIFLLLNSGAERNAVIAYICTFVAAQMSVLYSCLPLVWISIFNIPLLMVLNMFLGLTGVWGLVQFSFFISDQPFLAQTIEMGLFSLYPLVSVGLVTWLVAYLTSVRFAVYVAIIYGFLLLRVFLSPALSSFYKLQPPETKSRQILGSAEAAVALIVYLGTPCLIFFVSHIFSFWHGDIVAFIEMVLVAILPLFLITFIQLRRIYEEFNITLTQVVHARILLGLITLLLSCWLLHQSGISAVTYWMLPTIICYTLLGFALSKGSRYWFLSLLLATTSVFISCYAIYQVIPISLNIPLVSPFLLTFILVMNSLTSATSVVLAGASRWSRYLSPCLIVHSVVLVHSECFLLSRGFYSYPLAGLSILIEAYLLGRLQASSKISQACQWLAVSVHAMKFPYFILYVLKVAESDSHFGVLAIYSSAALAMITMKILLYEDQSELQPWSVVGYIVCAAGSMLAFLLNVLRPLSLQFFSSGGIVTSLLIDFIVTSALSCKLTLCNMKQYPNSFKVSSIILFFNGFSLLVQAPAFRDYVSPWLLAMIEAAVVLHLACSCSLLKLPNPRLYALTGGLLIGIPVGLTYSQFMIPSTSLVSIAAYPTLSVVAVILVLLLWRYSLAWKTKSLVQCTKDKLLHGTYAAFLTVSTSLFINDLLTLNKSSSLWDALFMAPSTIFICTICCILSITIRFFCLKWQQQDPFSYKPGLLPTFSNILTMVTYSLAVLSNPIPFPEIWNSASSIVLLCLQQDLKIFPTFRAAMRTSTIFAVCAVHFLIFSCQYSILWTKGFGFFGILEMLTLPLSIPILVITTTVLSQPSKYVLPEHSVILLAPLPVVIFIFGNSYVSWLLAGTSFVSGVWLLQKTSFGMQS